MLWVTLTPPGLSLDGNAVRTGGDIHAQPPVQRISFQSLVRTGWDIPVCCAIEAPYLRNRRSSPFGIVGVRVGLVVNLILYLCCTGGILGYHWPRSYGSVGTNLVCRVPKALDYWLVCPLILIFSHMYCVLNARNLMPQLI